MHALPLLLAVVLPVAAACGSGNQAAIDARPAPDAPAPDALTCPVQLLTGGIDVVAQGWSVVMQAPATLSYGPNFVKLQTSTGATTSGQLLLSHAGAVDVGMPFRLEVVMLVETVDPHNRFDAGAAILGSFVPPFGVGIERDEMIYLERDRIGWADDTQLFPIALNDNLYHTYVLAVDGSGNATVSVDGAPALTRKGFATNGAIAIGDQTNDANVDSTLRINSVARLCP